MNAVGTMKLNCLVVLEIYESDRVDWSKLKFIKHFAIFCQILIKFQYSVRLDVNFGVSEQQNGSIKTSQSLNAV